MCSEIHFFPPKQNVVHSMRSAVNSANVDTGLDAIIIYTFARQQSDMFNRLDAENKRGGKRRRFVIINAYSTLQRQILLIRMWKYM